MNPWEYPVPPILYKYLRADRPDPLSNCKVRFSQRAVFEDDHELQPDYVAFGTVQEIERHIVRGGQALLPIRPHLLARLIAQNATFQSMALNAATGNIESIHRVGIFCLTETVESDQMWREYADDGRGVIVAFDTTDERFRTLTRPRGMGKVSYSDEAFETFLGMMENNPFEPLYRKRTKYAFEREWRSIRLLKDLENTGNGIFLSSFDPGCVCEVILGDAYPPDGPIKTVLTDDARYRHVRILQRARSVGEGSKKI